MAHLNFSESIFRGWLLPQVLDGHGNYGVIAAGEGYVTPLGEYQRDGRKTGKVLPSHTNGFENHL